MTNLKMFCLTMLPEHGELINKLNYHPVGLGDKKFTNYFLQIRMVKIYHIKIHIMENILFVIGFGKIIIHFLPTHGLVCQYRKFGL